MQELYGIDLNTPGLLDDRTGRWLSVRIQGLLDTRDSRLCNKLFPPKPTKESS